MHASDIKKWANTDKLVLIPGSRQAIGIGVETHGVRPAVQSQLVLHDEYGVDIRGRRLARDCENRKLSNESLTDVALDDVVAFAVGVRWNGVLLLRAVILALDDDLERLLGNGALLESS